MSVRISVFSDADTYQYVGNIYPYHGAGIFQKHRDPFSQFHIDKKSGRLTLWGKEEPAPSFCALSFRVSGAHNSVLRGSSCSSGRRLHADETVAIYDNSLGGDFSQGKDRENTDPGPPCGFCRRSFCGQPGFQFQFIPAVHGISLRLLFQRLLHAAGLFQE